MTTPLERLQLEASELTPEERAKLAATLAYLDNKSREPDLSRDEQFVLDEIFRLCGARSPQKEFLRRYGIRKFRERVAELMDFVADTRKFLRPAQVQGVVSTCLSCLVEQTKSRHIPVSPQAVLDRLRLLAYAVDLQFPGYAEAGHLHRIASARQKLPA